MARYLVTGAAGFIARRVIEKLAAAGHDVVGVDNLNDSYDPRLKKWRLEQLSRLPEFRFYLADICNPECFQALSKYQRSFDGVIHLAARAGVRQAVDIPAVYLQTNAAGSLNLLEWCKREQVPKLVLASTSTTPSKH